MARSTITRPGRTLGVLVGLLVVLYGVIAAGVIWSSATWTPKLALDLEGGTQIVLKPRLADGVSGTISQTVVDQAVEIIRQRVNGSGVSEAEVTTSGSGANTQIIVSLPGKPDKKTEALVTQAAQLRFRAVLAAAAGSPQPTPTATDGTATGGATPTATGSATPSASASAGESATPSASATTSGSGRAVPKAFLGATTSPTPSTTAGDATATPSGGATATPSAKPTDASDTNWIDEKLAADFEKLDCSDPANLQGNGGADDAAKPLVACERDGTAKYILGPAEVIGTDVKTATFGLTQGANGASGPDYEVDLNFTSDGGKKFAAVTTRLAALQGDRNRFGIVLDGLVVSAPSTNEPITTGNARITGNFTLETAQTLADQLKYGALPLSFEVTTKAAISATLGSDSLRGGLLAGLIGLVLVVVYSLFQYRALGLVTVASLVIAGGVTYGLVVLLGWRQGYRLSLPGVAGLIVAIGITADSFIVYFERIRDEVRDGRPLRAAVEMAWSRARRTIIASDAVSFLAAVVLYVLAVGAVRGFAFTLGLTTIVDLAVVFLFTHPTVALLARTKFFGGGHKLSGFDPVHLGRAVTYTGRGRVRTPAAPAAKASGEPEDVFATAGAPAAVPAASGGRMTIAERRAAAERAARPGDDEPDGSDAGTGAATSGKDA
ncbi:protein translocase subunit SecD [Kineosporia sp. A_224]|uniref:protein translocase subunit SecD n=1 Tax=Kineosporia sp. A_224 TaxID=1962180 RepID=UPI000B4A987B|nr:protein translocase subunit SecD [Kineosporia sp. A_224]